MRTVVIGVGGSCKQKDIFLMHVRSWCCAVTPESSGRRSSWAQRTGEEASGRDRLARATAVASRCPPSFSSSAPIPPIPPASGSRKPILHPEMRDASIVKRPVVRDQNGVVLQATEAIASTSRRRAGRRLRGSDDRRWSARVTVDLPAPGRCAARAAAQRCERLFHRGGRRGALQEPPEQAGIGHSGDLLLPRRRR